MKLLKTVFLLTAVLFVACQSNPSKEESASNQPENQRAKDQFFTIHFAEIVKEKRDVMLSEIAENVDFVQFENNSEKALLGRISDIQITPNYIFIKHSGTGLLTQFNRNGKYVRHFGTLGRGPREYALIRKFSLDEQNKLVYIHTNWTRKILVYNFDGEYIKTIKFKAVERTNVTWSRDSLLISFGEPHVGNEPYVFIEHNATGDTLQTVANHNFWDSSESSNSMVGFWGQNIFYRFNNKLHMKGWYNDTVYFYNEQNKIVPKFFIDLKEHKIPDDLVYERKSSRPMPKNSYWIGVHETQDYIFVPYGSHYNIQTRKQLSDDEGCVLYNKTTKIGVAVNENEIGGFINDLTGGPDFKPLYTSDTTIYLSISALDMKMYLDSDAFKNREVKFPEQKAKLAELNRTLKEDDNHFLMVAKLKK
ncbi:6-bladed beta-propeller protein [Tangfeifania diversioriginum]|uniref:6-bladed beta-propeller protein n=1 Tax=Tangfeifania diversioriginum TaxID=1168035 RepID=A0A1M6NT26_9BACT|nr:6-bladed beta-propeller [Tangfeifania diversioriginum]SHJ98903.1 6-bladed beta-propeller protein [Tangfeifania diversioriginum]